MSLLSELKHRTGAVTKRKVLGRGDASGLGGTCGKGHKGQRARSGGKIRRGFEGGQTPLMRRLPKFGFKNSLKIKYKAINLDRLVSLNVEKIGLDELKNLAGKGFYKILGQGKIEKAIVISAHKFSKSAIIAIESCGGKIEVINK